jgi:hypothetical protein
MKKALIAAIPFGNIDPRVPLGFLRGTESILRSTLGVKLTEDELADMVAGWR